MIVITSKRELIDMLDAHIGTLKRRRDPNPNGANLGRRLTATERTRLDGAINAVSLVRDVLNDAAINIVNPDVERAVTTRREGSV